MLLSWAGLPEANRHAIIPVITIAVDVAKKGANIMAEKIKVAFICVHNSCRSQMAEAISKLIASDSFESYSAGTETKPKINGDAVAVIKELYGIDMNASQKSKLIEEIPPVDVVITMGCNVNCPHLPYKYKEDWGLEDPSGKGKDEFIKTAKMIEQKVLDLKDRLNNFVYICDNIPDLRSHL